MQKLGSFCVLLTNGRRDDDSALRFDKLLLPHYRRHVLVWDERPSRGYLYVSFSGTGASSWCNQAERGCLMINPVVKRPCH